MSKKQSRKDAKRKKRKAAEAKARHLKQAAKLIRPVIDDGGPTPPDQLLETMLSPDIPESEWPNDWRERIIMKLRQLEKKGQQGHVKRRPDGSYTVMGDPEWIGPEIDSL